MDVCEDALSVRALGGDCPGAGSVIGGSVTRGKEQEMGPGRPGRNIGGALLAHKGQ